jgi:hypothetical protein
LLSIFAGVLAVLGLVACGGGDDEAPGGNVGITVTAESPTEPAGEATSPGGGATGAAADFDACNLLLPEDVEPLIGSTPEPTDDPVGPFATCSYWDTSSSFVQFQICRCLPGDELEQSREAGAAALGVEVAPVEGTGERAFWLEGILWVQQGDVVFNLWISRPAYFQPDGSSLAGEELEAVALPDTRQLAQTLLERIE